MIDLNDYKQKPFELTDNLVSSMTVTQAFDLMNYIHDIARVRQDELKIHSINAKMISEFMQKSLELKKVQ